MDESAISVDELLEGAKSVSKGLETLRGEHEAFLSEVSDTAEEGIITTVKISLAVRAILEEVGWNSSRKICAR